jgi:hypothetical protein
MGNRNTFLSKWQECTSLGSYSRTAVLNLVGSTAVSRLNLLARLNPWLNLLAMPIFLAMLIFSGHANFLARLIFLARLNFLKFSSQAEFSR